MGEFINERERERERQADRMRVGEGIQCVCKRESVCVCLKEREGVRGEVREQGILTEGEGSVQLTSMN